MNTTRRAFLAQSGAAATLAGAPKGAAAPIKMGLYSITYAGLWYRGGR